MGFPRLKTVKGIKIFLGLFFFFTTPSRRGCLALTRTKEKKDPLKFTLCTKWFLPSSPYYLLAI